MKPTNHSWRVDETYLFIKGRCAYSYRAINSTGATIDFVLSPHRTADAAKLLFSRALAEGSRPQPRVIDRDKYAGYPAAIYECKEEGCCRGDADTGPYNAWRSSGESTPSSTSPTLSER